MSIGKLMSIEEVERLLQRGKTHNPEMVAPLAKQLAETMRELEIEKARAKVESYHCNGESVIAWLDKPKRKEAILAFTAGYERQIAYRFESLVHDLETCSQGLAHNEDLCLRLQRENKVLREALL